MNQSINTDSKNSKEPQQKYRLGTVSIKKLGGLNRFYGRPTSPSPSIMAQNIQLFGPCVTLQQSIAFHLKFYYYYIVFIKNLSCMTKPTQWHVRPAKTQISLGIRPVWSESSLSAWRKLGSLATHWAHSEDSDQTGRMHRLIWVFAGRTCHLCWFVVWWLICNIWW